LQKILFGLLFTVTMMMAELQHIWATPDFVNQNIKIIDIRTPSEWEETGIVENSYTIMFFDEKDNFNVENFLNELDEVVNKNEQFALICRTGSRTGRVSELLSTKFGYNVINLKGGITKMIEEGYLTVPTDGYILPVEVDVECPLPVKNLKIDSINAYSSRIRWEEGSSDTVGYKIYLNGTLFRNINAEKNSYILSGLDACTDYFYNVIAYNDAGNSRAIGGCFKTKEDDFSWLVSVQYIILDK